MANKIEGGDNWELSFDSLEEAAVEAFGEASETVKEAVCGEGKQKGVGDADDDSWEVGQKAEDFWDELSGAANQAAESVEQTVTERVTKAAEFAVETREELDEVLTEADQALHELGDMPDSIVAGGEELYRELRSQQAKLSDKVGEILDSHPEQAVFEAADKILDGSIRLGEEMVRVATEEAPEALENLSDAYEAVTDQVIVDVITAGAQAISDQGELLEEVGAVAEDVLDSEMARTMGVMLSATSAGMALESARTSMLKTAQIAQAAPEVARDLIKHPEKLRALVEDLEPETIREGVEELDVGDAYTIQRGIEASAHLEVGGVVGNSVETSVERTAKDAYQVSVNVQGKLGAGAGGEAAGQGGRGDAVAEIGGKIVLEFSGPDAAEDASRVLAAANGDVTELFAMLDNPPGEAELVELEGTFAEQAEVEAFGHKGELGVEGAASLKTIDGRQFVGKSASMGLSFGIETPSVQVGDDLAQAWLESDSLGHAGLDAMMQGLPPEVTRGIKEVYGPTGGLKLAAEPKVTLGMYTPAGAERPLRLEFDYDVSLRAGRSEFQGNVGLTITDVYGLAEALGTSGLELAGELSRGELSIAQLRSRAEDIGVDIDRFVDIEGPTLEMSKEDMAGVENLFGVTNRWGKVENFVLYSPTDEDFLENLKEAVDASDEASADGLEDINSRRLAAHTTRV